MYLHDYFTTYSLISITFTTWCIATASLIQNHRLCSLLAGIMSSAFLLIGPSKKTLLKKQITHT